MARSYAALALAMLASLALPMQSGSPPLHEASHKGHLAVVKLLLEHGANVDAKDVVRIALYTLLLGRSPPLPRSLVIRATARHFCGQLTTTIVK